MRILVANPSVGVGGAELHSLELCSFLSDRGHAVTHAMERTSHNSGLFDEDANRLVNLPIGWHRSFYPREEKQRQEELLREAIEEHKPDLLVIPLSYPDAAPGLLNVAVESSLPTLVIFHLARRNINLSDLQKRTYARAAATRHIHWVAVSPWLADTISILTGIPVEVVTVIRNGAFRSLGEVADLSDREVVRADVIAEFGLHVRDTIALTVARIDQQKNHLDLVAAADAIVKVRPDVKFVWLGEGPSSEKVDDSIRALGLSSHIMRLGHRADVERFYKAADMFVLPTSVEGDSLSLAEAAFYGLPIITTNASGQDETYPHREAALIVGVGAIEALGDAVLELTRDKILAHQLSVGAVKMATQHSKARMLARYDDLIAQISGTVELQPQQPPIWLVIEDLEDLQVYHASKGVPFNGGWLIAEGLEDVLKGTLPAISQEFVYPAGQFGFVLSREVFTTPRLIIAKAAAGLENVRRWAANETRPGNFVSSSSPLSVQHEAAAELAALTTLAHTRNFGSAWLLNDVLLAHQDVLDWVDFNRKMFVAASRDSSAVPLYMKSTDGCFQAPLRDLYLSDRAGLSYLERLDRSQRLAVLRAIIPQTATSASAEVIITIASFMRSASAIVIQDFVEIVMVLWTYNTEQRVPILSKLQELVGLPTSVAYSNTWAQRLYRALGEARFDMVQYLGEGRGTSGFGQRPEKVALYFFRRIPFPIKSGSDARVVSTLRLLQSLDFGCVFATYCKPSEVREVSQAADAFRKNFGVDVDVHILTRREADKLTKLESSTEWDTFMMGSLHRHFHRLSELLNPDLVFINFPQYAYLSICGGSEDAVTIIDGHDIVSSRSSFSEQIDRLAGRDERKIITTPDPRLFEISEYMYDGGFDDEMEMQLYNHFSTVLAISPSDYDYLSNRCPQTSICPMPIICENIIGLGDEGGIPLFVGSVNQLNAIAASYIVNDLLPKMRALYPSFEVRFVGGICDILPDLDGIVKEGIVDQMEYIYRKTSFVLAPLFWGSGQNVKIIEAMGYGVPSITFSDIAGRCGVTTSEAMIARDAWEFFECTRELHRDTHRVRELAENCIRRAMNEHSVATARVRLQHHLMRV